jgi:hypothetical protein
MIWCFCPQPRRDYSSTYIFCTGSVRPGPWQLISVRQKQWCSKKGCQNHKYKFHIDTFALEHTKNYTYFGLNISATGNFHKAVNDLRDKARRAFYAIKRNIKFNLPIRIWQKILESVIEPIAFCGCEVWGPITNQEFTKWDKHQIEIACRILQKYPPCTL